MEKTLFSSKTIYRYTRIILLIIVFLYCGEGVIHTQNDIQHECQSTMQSAKRQIDYRVQMAINLLKALAENEEFSNPSLPAEGKVVPLEEINEYMGYMMIRYVDTEMNVYSQWGSTSLASREYMQRLFATEEPQVTDSFAAGADGVTLNYTVAVPMYYEGQMSGCLFCAIYFDEVQKLLTDAARKEGIEVTLLGSSNQMMSATDTLHYGESYLEYIRNARIIGNTKNSIEEDLLREDGGDGYFWMNRGLNVSYASYTHIANTSWSVIATISFWHTFWGKMMEGVSTLVFCVILLLMVSWLMGQYIPAQKERMQTLVESVRKLERRLYLDEKQNEQDFDQMLKLTSEGLNDNLTGVVTRSVFMNQIQGYLDKLSADSVAAMCFVDLDDLKKLNDQHGHEAGDKALREIGFVLREYEKKFDGLVGRYGGDEFTLFMEGFQDEEELEAVMRELSGKLRIRMPEFGAEVVAHCSIGVAVWKEAIAYDALLKQADQALYKVKHSGKGTFEIYKGGNVE